MNMNSHTDRLLVPPTLRGGEGRPVPPKPRSGDGPVPPKPRSGDGPVPPKPRSGDGPVPPKPRSGEGGWYGVLAPPAAWAVQEWLGWYFGQRMCQGLAPPSVRWILFGVSVAALVVALVGVARGWSAWRETVAVDSDHRDRVDFVSFGGFLISCIFALAIVWAGLATAFLFDCGWMR